MTTPDAERPRPGNRLAVLLFGGGAIAAVWVWALVIGEGFTCSIIVPDPRDRRLVPACEEKFGVGHLVPFGPLWGLAAGAAALVATWVYASRTGRSPRWPAYAAWAAFLLVALTSCAGLAVPPGSGSLF